MTKASRFFPVALLVLGAGIATPACAGQIYGSRGVYYGDVERRAYDAGYREGVEEGQNDARHSRQYSYSRHDEYRDADAGYRRIDGNPELYRRSFRHGFQVGYDEAYKRYANYNRYPGGNSYPTYPSYPTSYPSGAGIPRGAYSSPAAENGYRDGLEAGRNDARNRDRFDPVRAKRYREGDHDYNSRDGSRDEYKREYRAAFVQGYREGYGRGR